ncbi:MAG: hypothetical protein JOZ98_10925 [Solirubrobacterales bacterium]|nr:hypothetical protein [Solirubrobacterales bacterium]
MYTNLVGDTQPLLRYRSRDLGRLSDSEPCECGRTLVRIERLEGRSDDMISYRGQNFFPSAVEQVVREFAGISPEYRIVVDRRRTLAALGVQVEVLAAGRDDPSLPDRLAEAIRRAVGVRARIEMLEPGALAAAGVASGLKAKRVIELGPEH